MKKLFLKINYGDNEANPFLNTANEGKTLATNISSNEPVVLEKAKEVTEQSVQAGNVTMSAEQFQQFMAGMVATVAKIAVDNNNPQFDSKVLATAIENAIVNSSSGRRRAFGNQKTFTKEDIPHDDILETPAMFMSFCKTTIIFDDLIAGHTVNMPYAPVVFKEFLRYEDPNNKGQIITQCMAVVESKKQAEFIRSHTFFNIRYFEKLEAGKSYNTQVIDRLVSAFNEVKNMNDHQVKQKCMEFGVVINTNDFAQLRKELAQKKAQMSATDFDDFQKRYIEDTSKGINLRDTRKTEPAY